MSIEEFYNDIRKNAKANTELNQLYKKPVPEKGIQVPKTQVFNKNVYFEADCLYMPEDDGYKYILVCVDLYDGTLDAEQLKELKPNDIVKAFKEIFKRSYLEFPVFLTLDKGQEFHNDMVISEGFVETLSVLLDKNERSFICYTTIEPPIFTEHVRVGKIIYDLGNDFNTFDEIKFKEI
jgi:hypothetical protein